MSLLGCASKCRECRRGGEGPRVQRESRNEPNEDDEDLIEDDPLRLALEQALLQQNQGQLFNNGLGALQPPAGFNQLGAPQFGVPQVFDQNNQGQGLGLGAGNGALPTPSGQGAAAQPQVSEQSASFSPAPVRASASVAADAPPVRRLQALVDTSTHGAEDGSAAGPTRVQRRTAE